MRNHVSGAGRRGVVVALAVAALVAGGVTAAISAQASSSPLVSTFSGKCLDVTGNVATDGTTVEIWDCNGQANQTWTTTSAGALQTFGTSKCLDATGGGTAAGTALIIWSCNGGANQRFSINSDGTVRGTQSGLCVDVTGANSASGTAVVLWTCNGGSNQKWSTSTGTGGGTGGGGGTDGGGTGGGGTGGGTGGGSSGSVHGYATVSGTTTGGSGGPTVTVTSLSALTTEAAKSGAEVIRVNGRFTGYGDITVASNKTIVGVGSGSGLVGAGLTLKGVSNVIIQNLNISKVTAASGTGDAIHLETSSHVWIDHNTLSSDQNNGKDYYDGLIDLSHAADYVTISWNYLHDHYKASLVGHSDSNGSQDSGHLHVTYDHNYFRNINSRTPSLRFGTGHVYDNYFVNGDTGVHSRENAQMLVQNNVFSGVSTPIETTGDSPVDGYVNQSGNSFGGGVTQITRTGSFTSPPYAYSLDATSSVASTVSAGAGAGHI